MQTKVPREAQTAGAYILHLRIRKRLFLKVGALGEVFLPAGRYVYVGSARRSIAGRVSRHLRLAESKTGKRHWHIDYLLLHPATELTSTEAKPFATECAVAKDIASREGASVPVARFGSTDCRSGCEAHLFRIKTSNV